MNTELLAPNDTWEFEWQQKWFFPESKTLLIHSKHWPEQTTRQKLLLVYRQQESYLPESFHLMKSALRNKIYHVEKLYENMQPMNLEKAQEWKRISDSEYDYRMPTNIVEYTFWPWEEGDYIVESNINANLDRLLTWFLNSRTNEFNRGFAYLPNPTRWMEMKFVLAMMTECNRFKEEKLNVYMHAAITHGQCSYCNEIGFVKTYHPFAEYRDETENSVASAKHFEFWGDSRNPERLCGECSNKMVNCEECCKATGFEWGLNHFVEPKKYTKNPNSRI